MCVVSKALCVCVCVYGIYVCVVCVYVVHGLTCVCGVGGVCVCVSALIQTQ